MPSRLTQVAADDNRCHRIRRAKLTVMVNLESETAHFNWTFDRIGDLEQGQHHYGFDGAVWKADAIRSYEIGEGELIFDVPAEWAKGLPPAQFRRTAEGRYEYRSERVIYNAVRADTLTTVTLTGRWTETDAGKGVFITVLPIKQGAEILLEAAAMVPLESHVPELVANP